jgi:hypothetical protein
MAEQDGELFLKNKEDLAVVAPDQGATGSFAS